MQAQVVTGDAFRSRRALAMQQPTVSRSLGMRVPVPQPLMAGGGHGLLRLLPLTEKLLGQGLMACRACGQVWGATAQKCFGWL